MQREGFGRLLEEGIKKLAAARRVSLRQAHDDLADRLAVSTRTIYDWRKGKRLPQPEFVAGLAHIFVSHGEATNSWVRTFLRKGDYSPSDSVDRLLQELFPAEKESANIAPPASANGTGGTPPDLPKTEAQLRLLGAELPADMMTARVPPLPGFHTERRQLVAAVTSVLMAKESQILVMWGPGGVGKTTLAIETARALASAFPDGIAWIDARAYTSVSTIQETLAQWLHLPLDDDSPAQRGYLLQARLRTKRCLLVLDDLPALPDLPYLRLNSETSRIICTSRDAKVADLLQAPLLRLSGFDLAEGQALLARWAGRQVAGEELVTRLGGLPLALSLCGAQLRLGIEPKELLAAFRAEQVDLSILDLDDPRTQAESLSLCFEITFQHLSAPTQQRFAQLGYFAGVTFQEAALAAVWGLDANETRATLKQLLRFALIERIDRTYRLHPLLRDYVRQKLAVLPAQETGYQRRHAAWYVRYALYHPALLPENNEAAPYLESAWADSVAGVRWATASAPRLAAQAVLLAHTERPALLEEIGLPLIEAIETYLNQISGGPEQALLTEVLGDLYLLHQNIPAGAARFEQAVKLWQTVENGLASSQAQLRLAGAYLLAQDKPAAAQAARQARLILEASLPISDQDMAQADRLFYWFNLVYNTLVRWESLPEEDVAALARCTEAMDQPAFQARGLSIYRLWCTTRAVARSEATRRRGRELAVQAYYLWRAAGRPDRADDVVSFGKYWLTHRYSRRTARRYAQRRANTTPPINPAHVRLIKNEGMRWWLQASAAQRVGWLSWMLPRYLAADNRPRHPVTGQYLSVLKPGDRAYGWVDDIINVGSLGAVGRRLMLGSQPPPDHFLDGHEWRAFTGQRVLPLPHEAAKALVKQYLQNLEVEASTG